MVGGGGVTEARVATDIIDDVARALAGVRFNYSDEAELQAGLAQALSDAKVPFEREVVIGNGERVDFLVEGVAVEAKIKGAPSKIFRQLYRYAKCADIRGLVVVHADPRFYLAPDTFRDVAGRALPLRVLHLQGSWF
jgi:hypothetical protein